MFSDEACQREHAKLIAGKCPWCGQFIVSGQVVTPTRETISEKQLAGSTRTLREVVKTSGCLSPKASAYFISKAADALMPLHAKGFVHRHIQPDTILISEEGHFSLSEPVDIQELEPFEVEGYSDVISTSVDFLAPELAINSHRADARADIYSLGCTFYLLLTGSVPFPEGSIPERLMKHQKDEPTPIRELRPDVPVGLDEICCRMMAKRPEDRIQSAGEVVSVLERWVKAAD